MGTLESPSKDVVTTVLGIASLCMYYSFAAPERPVAGYGPVVSSIVFMGVGLYGEF